MITPADPLPDDLETAHQLIRELLATLHEQLHLNEKLQHQLEQLLRHRFGKKSERVDPAQLLLFAQEILRGPSPRRNPTRSPSRRPLRVRPRRMATAVSRCPRACRASRSCSMSPPNNSRAPTAAPCGSASARKSANSSNTSPRR